MNHPLSTAHLLERAATASNEPDHHHVTAAYHAARAYHLLANGDGSQPADLDYELAADIAALEMAHAAAASLASRLYESEDRRVADFLHKISTHYVRQLENLIDDIEHLADAEALAVTP